MYCIIESSYKSAIHKNFRASVGLRGKKKYLVIYTSTIHMYF